MSDLPDGKGFSPVLIGIFVVACAFAIVAASPLIALFVAVMIALGKA